MRQSAGETMLAIRRTIAVKGGTNRRLTPELGSWREAVKKGVVGRRKIGLASLLQIRRFSEQCTAVQNKS